ncbi:MAG: P-II family nitrogen regulator [Pirellulales bacterium]
MKRIEAIIRHFKLEDVRNALNNAGIPGMTAIEVQGFGRQKGHCEMYRGTEYAVEFVPKVMIVLYVHDTQVKSITEVIVKAARTGQIGDGKLVVSDLSKVVRIRTGEEDDVAV